MSIALSIAQVNSLWEHLSKRLYNVIHIRRKFFDGTLLGGLMLKEDKIIGMFSFNEHTFDFEVMFENGKPVFLVNDHFRDQKRAALIEKRLANYLMSRVEQEKEMDKLEQKFNPRYSDGEIYLRRKKGTSISHLVNMSTAKETGLVNLTFANRLSGMNLVIRFKPKR